MCDCRGVREQAPACVTLTRYSTVTTRSRAASPPRQAGGTSTRRHGEVQPTGPSAVSAVGSPPPQRHGRGSAALGVAPGQGCHPSGGVRHTRPHPSLLVGPVGREAGVPPGQWPRGVGFAPIPPRGGLGPTAIVHGTVCAIDCPTSKRSPARRIRPRVVRLDGVGGISNVTGNETIHTIER